MMWRYLTEEEKLNFPSLNSVFEYLIIDVPFDEWKKYKTNGKFDKAKFDLVQNPKIENLKRYFNASLGYAIGKGKVTSKDGLKNIYPYQVLKATRLKANLEDLNGEVIEDKLSQAGRAKNVLEEAIKEGIAKRYNNLPKISKKYELVRGWQVMPHQKEACDFLLTNRTGLIDFQPGLGKTIIALLACSYSVPHNKKVLVICEKKAIPMWKEEGRLEDTKLDAVNFEYIKKACIRTKRGKGWNFKYDSSNKFIKIEDYATVIVDESHYLANFTQEGKAVLALLKDFKGGIYSLTATPYRNTMLDYWYQCQLLQHPLGELNEIEFKRLFDINYYSEPNTTLFAEYTKDLILTKTLKEIGINIDVERKIIDISMDQKFWNGYEEIKRDAKQMMVQTGNKTMTINTAQIRLHKLCAEGKIEWTKDYLRARLDKPTIVISNYNQAVLDPIADSLQNQVFKATNKNKQVLFEQFTSGENNLFLAQRRISQSSLNLQNADTLILHDLHWSLDFLVQSIGRIKRIGQKATKVTVLMPIIKNSIEDKVLSVLQRKENERESIIAGVNSVDMHLKKAKVDTQSNAEIRQILEAEILY